MPPFTNMIALLLISQVCYVSAVAGSKSLVRGQAQTVEADGTVKNANPSSSSSSSLVDVSISASGQTEVASAATHRTSLDSRVQRLVTEVEAMAQSGQAPREKTKDIQSIVNDELLPGLHSERDFAAEQVAASVAAIGKCNENGLAKQQEIKGKTEVEVGTARTTHVTCRKSEKEKHSTKTEECLELDTFLNSVKVPAEIPAKRGRDEMVEYVKTMNAYFCPMEPSTGEMDDKCKTATNEHADERATCNRHQATFESDFCTWRTMLGDECEEHSACYKAAIAAYDGVKTNTTALVTKLKTEYASLKKILCYLNVWLKDGNEETVDADQYTACNGADVDTSPMDVPFPEAPAQAQCPMTAVEKYPGTKEFETAEYTEFAEYVNPVIACLEEGGTAALPATETTQLWSSFDARDVLTETRNVKI